MVPLQQVEGMKPDNEEEDNWQGIVDGDAKAAVGLVQPHPDEPTPPTELLGIYSVPHPDKLP